MKKNFFSFFSIMGLLTGCCVGPVYNKPEYPVPCEWHSQKNKMFNNHTTEGVVWWETFQDEILNKLIIEAASQNLDLQIAAIRVIQSREIAKLKIWDNYPHIDASLNYDHVYYSKQALVDGLVGAAIPVKGNHVKRDVNFYELGFDAEWELDLFGFTKHEVAALQAQSEATQEILNGAWITLSAEIARNYIQLRGFQFQLETSLHLIELENESIALTEELSERGVINQSDFNHALAQLDLLKSETPMIKMKIMQSIYRLSVLLGKMPGDLVECLCPYGHLPSIPEEISIGIPSELLRRRPDIVKAERELAVATEKVGSAVAALFPRFSLRGFLGDIATKPGSLFNSSSATWLAGPQLLLPVFNSKLLEQNVEYSKRETQQAWINYQKTILEAVEEAENAILQFQQSEQKWVHLHEAQQKESQSLDFAYELYQRGSINKFELIKAQKALINIENQLVSNKIDRLNHYIALYKALGGSWGGVDCRDNI